MSLPKLILVFLRMKIYKEKKRQFHNIIGDEVLWTQHNMLQTHKLKCNYLNHVNNVILIYLVFWLILKYNTVSKKWWKKHYIRKKILCGVFSSTCMWASAWLLLRYFLYFILFEPWDSYEKNSYKKPQCIHENNIPVSVNETS